MIKFPTRIDKINLNLFYGDCEIQLLDNMTTEKPIFNDGKPVEIEVSVEDNEICYNVLDYSKSEGDFSPLKVALPKGFYKKIVIGCYGKIHINDINSDDDIFIMGNDISVKNSNLKNASIGFNYGEKPFLNIENSTFNAIRICIDNKGKLSINSSALKSLIFLKCGECENISINKSNIARAELRGCALQSESSTFENLYLDGVNHTVLHDSCINGLLDCVDSDIVLNHCDFNGVVNNNGSTLNFENYWDLYNIDDDYDCAYLFDDSEYVTVLKHNHGKVKY